MADTRYLVQQKRTWFAVVEVPPSLRDRLGRRLKRTLGTHDVHLARAKRWAVIAELKASIEAARSGPPQVTLDHEALAYRTALTDAKQLTEQSEYRDDNDWLETSSETLLSSEIAERAYEIEDRHGPQAARTFADIALGRSTPLAIHVDDWLAQGGLRGSLTEKTKIEHRRAVRELVGWLEAERMGATVEAVTRKVAGRFVAEHLLRSGRHHRTTSKVVHTLSGYWQWLQRRGHIEDDGRNPWTRQATSRHPKGTHHAAEERAFTDKEVAALLAESPNPALGDFMLMGALTGMRREEIGRLTVADCAGGIFVVRAGKTAAARRRVPIHPDLSALVHRRCQGAGPDAYLFPELGHRVTERTDPIGKRFATYRRKLGIQDGEGRRSLVNFHSFRRWFTTAAINANQPPHVVSLLVGHSEGRQGMTLGRYWNGAEDAALRTCVEAVKLPRQVGGENAKEPEDSAAAA
jgi:integrase